MKVLGYLFLTTSLIAVSNTDFVAAEASLITASQVRQTTFKLDIPAQKLTDALRDFASQTKLQLVYSQKLVAQHTSEGINGSHDPIDALKILLRKSGLLLYQIDNGTYAVMPENASDAAVKGMRKVSFQSSNQTAIKRPQRQEKRATSSAVNELDDEFSFEEIVVTAQIREQSLQEVPVSVTAVDGELLERTNVTSLLEIAGQVPGFLGGAFTQSKPVFVIRGVGNTFSDAGSNKPTAIFVDDVYISREGATSFDLFDLEQVTVLRGPQGTLFGRNVTGGAVLFKTTKPSLDGFKGKAEVGYGNYDALDLRGYVSVPVSDEVAFKLSASRRTRDGFAVDRLNGAERDDLDTFNMRGQLLWVPSDDLDLLLSADYSTDENGNRGLSSTLFGSDDDNRTTELDTNQFFDRDSFGVSARANLQTEKGEFVSITAYRKSDIDELYSRVGASYTLLPFAFQDISRDTETPKTFTQELRFISESWDRWNFVAGAFYFNENIDRTLGRERLLAGVGAQIQDREFIQHAKTESIALYTDVGFNVLETLTLNVGGRYTYEKKNVEGELVDGLNNASNYSATASRSWNKFTPRVALTWSPQDDLNFFASWTKGFTAGGFNTEADRASSFQDSYEEENITSYEAGLKAQFLDRRITTNLTFFYSDYTDKQEFVFDRTIFVGNIVNAADARMQGFEIEAILDVTEGLRLSGNYAYLDAEYKQFDIPGDTSRTGNKLGYAPENSFFIAADYEREIGNEGLIFFNVSYDWRDEHFGGSTNNAIESFGSRGVLNASLGYGTSDDRWRITAWMRNAGDIEYGLVRSNFITQAVALAPPRTYGVKLTANF